VAEFVTRSPEIRELLALAERAACTEASILITGESGTGKNRLARHIHDVSERRSGPYVEVPCANLPPELLESELFGHQKGAFTDAHEDRPGRFENADGGTLFLDEIQELAPEVQAKVLRALDEKRFERLGGRETLEIDARILASTREDPDRLVAEGRLREDLFYRLNVVRVHLPSLRDRPGDIRPLAMDCLEESRRRHRLGRKQLSEEALERLEAYPWPGNVRELVHVIESAAILADGDEIGLADLPAELGMSSPAMLRSAADREMSLDELEAAYIDEVLRRTRGNKSAAARILGIHRKTLHEKLRARSSGES
jgi:DNA-binding NtrC family response regulator